MGTPAGKGEGVFVQRGGDVRRAIALDSPSFVLAHPELPLLYAASELGSSRVTVLSRDDEARVLAVVETGGADACHLLLGADARTLYVSHYGSGDVAVVRLGPDGLPLSAAPDQLLGHSGSGPNAARQEAPHAHSAALAPGGGHLLVVDLGTDELRRYEIGAEGLLTPSGVAAHLPPGSGPRHLAARGHLLYVTCELDNRLRTLRWDAASATADVIAETPSTLAPNRTGEVLQDGHVALVGDVLLVSVRGADVISMFDVAPEGELTYRGAFDAGHWPRFFAAIGDRLHVGAERGHEVRDFALADVLGLAPENEAGAIAQLPYASAPLTSPACVTA